MHAFILSDIPPSPKYTGGQVLFKILDNLPDIDFSFLWINQWNLKISSGDHLPKNSKIIADYLFEPEEFTKRIQRFLDRLGSTKILRPLSLVFRGLVYYVRLLAISLKIIILIRLRKPDLIWLVLQGDKLAIIYRIICFFNKDKVILLHQWDPISWWLKATNRPQWFIGLTNKVVDSLEKNAHLNIVPSKNWANKLTSQNKNVHALDNFFDDTSFEYPYLNFHRPGVLNAIFIGQLYANDELTKVCQALLDFEKRFKVEVIVHYYGLNPATELAGIKVVSYGFLPHQQLTEEISIYDLALLPYPMESGYAETALLSFPSKCRQYLLSGLPILALAPIQSGIHDFLSQNMPPHSYCNMQSDSHLDPNIFLDFIANLGFEDKKHLHLKVRGVGKKYFSASAEMLPFQIKLSELVHS